MLCFLEEAVQAFYADSVEAFDKVPQSNLICKASDLGAGGCHIEIINDKFVLLKQDRKTKIVLKY